MNLNNGYGNGIGYKEHAYNAKGTMVYTGTYTFQARIYELPQPKFNTTDYNLIFNLK